MKYIHKDKPVDLMKYTFLNPKTNSLTHFQNISFQKFGTTVLLMSKTKTLSQVTDLILINLFYDMVEAPMMIFFLPAYIHFTLTHRTLLNYIIIFCMYMCL